MAVHDCGGKAFSVLAAIVGSDTANIDVIEAYVSSKFPAGGLGISSIEAPGKRIYFTPSAFQVPATETELDLVSVMMPFGTAFGAVHAAVAAAADRNAMRCQRADDIWIHSTVVQDIFSLIYRSFIVVCDFTGMNPNVFYEAGIAHTLGKHVDPDHPASGPHSVRSPGAPLPALPGQRRRSREALGRTHEPESRP
jgi:hypothetical protein